MSMDQITSSSVYHYLRNECKDVMHKTTDTCEDVCTILCKEIGISPVTRLLFSLRISGTNNWLPGSRTLKPNVQYDFRLRFQIPKISNLKLLDKTAYNYFYHQVRNDVLNSRIPEIVYPKYKDNILGLCVTDMYREMIENNRPVNLLTRWYREYIPRELEKNHKIFVKRKIETMLRSIKKKEHDADYVKGIYLEDIAKMAPNYLTEEVECITSYLKEDELKKGTCPVKIQFTPFHNEQPGLRIYYSYKQTWKLISQIEDIYAIIVKPDKSEVMIEMKDAPTGFKIEIVDKETRESFVSCLAGYYRLMVKWNMDLCRDFQSPSLARLKTIKCHGPIGGEFSYKKIEDKCNNTLGAFIVRQCEREYDTYYLDIVSKGNQPETLKITYDNQKWLLHTADIQLAYDELINLVQHLPDKPKKLLRISPTEYDKPPLLLLCTPPQALTAKKTVIDLSELSSLQPRIISASDDLLLFKDSQREDDGGTFTRMRGEWKLPADKKLEVTLKILRAQKIEKHLLDFMNLTDKWCKLDSNEIVRFYGITLQQPIAMVMEAINLGPLDELLRSRSREQVGLVCLIDAAHTLVRALHYLQERKMIHGRIRCSSLQVSRYESKTNLVVKLGDPGFARPLTKSDIPWIPVEHFDHLEGAKSDMKAEIWAAATTMWEIFSRGVKIDRIERPKDFFANGNRLPPPEETNVDNQALRGLYGIMREGWDVDPDKRFSPQLIFTKLINARENILPAYDTIGNGRAHGQFFTDNSTIGSKHSLMSNDTDETYVRNGDSYSFASNGSELRSNHSNSSTISESSYTHGIPTFSTEGSMNSGSSGLTLLASCSEVHANEYLDNIPYALEWDECRIVFRGEIGKGNYGKVYLGQLEDNQNHIVEVALKTFNIMPNPEIIKDMNREAGIMKRLNHPNIVKILGFVDNPRIIIVMEHIRHSSFDKYLCSNAPNITTQILLKFAKDIASGMRYLQEQKIIHRDLAARNILVASEDCVKISDFGLAQAADSNGYYVMRHSRDLPIKWYAPESLRTNKFSFKSDVWSFGITVFEMFSRGKRPELEPGKDLTSIDLLELLDKGKRLEQPSNCPDRIYNSLMLRCWNQVPNARPSFVDLLNTIDNLIQEFGESI